MHQYDQHFDHIGALDDVVNKYEVPLYMNKEEFSFLKDPDNFQENDQEYAVH
jgi:glyoxylase-like metal-dependent hydrolase (beta-lactamase superfamily II)